ncbi:MAG: NAD(P)-dependent alcohol dehydrogenase [Byssovorax sp.]
MIETPAYAAFDPRSPLRPHVITRREPGDHDVLIDIAYCGICHSDVHQARDEWGGSTFPMVPGHEIVGHVAKVGAKVTRFQVGDPVGVGCMVGSCGVCGACKKGMEQYCEDRVIWTYNSTDADGSPTQGGYSTRITVREDFVLRVRKGLPLDKVAPLLCAGITTYSPLKHWGIGPGRRLAVAGLGGLGHMAVKIGRALGAEVTVLSSSDRKSADALRFGAHEVIVSSAAGALEKNQNRFDLLIDTVSAPHDLAAYLKLLRLDGAMVLVGIPETPATVPAFPLIGKRRSLAGSLIGGIAETQEMLDFCADHEIFSEIETIAAAGINEAYERLVRGDVRYRFVIDCETFR